MDVGKLLKYMHKIMYPEAVPLMTCNDPLLLKSNGGSLSYEEWSDRKTVYVKMDRLSIYPAKGQYMLQNVSNTNNLTAAAFAKP
jgi:hypothetical protein